MKRKDFLTSIGLAYLVGISPLNVFSKNKKEEISEAKIKFSDIFTKRKTNMNLCRLKKSEFSQELFTRIKSDKIPVYDTSPVYCSDYSIRLPYREEYDPIELRNFFELLYESCSKRGVLFYNDHDGIMRFFIDKKSMTVVPDIFTANSWNLPWKQMDPSTKFYSKQERLNNPIDVDYKHPMYMENYFSENGKIFGEYQKEILSQ